MKKALLIIVGMIVSVLAMYGQNTSVTTNNTITINGDVYYFRPSTTKSSPLPRSTPATGFIGEGHWYGEDAARAWASIVDWAVERCVRSEGTVKPADNNIVYIHQVHAVPVIDNTFGVIFNGTLYGGCSSGVVLIYYWIVGRNERMEDGRREIRVWYF
jgi:hypothetical protein